MARFVTVLALIMLLANITFLVAAKVHQFYVVSICQIFDLKCCKIALELGSCNHAQVQCVQHCKCFGGL